MQHSFEDEKYVTFRKWIKLNGCKVSESLMIPSLKDGSVGVSTTDTIPSHKVILSIP